jgi:hypothetical protein
VVVYGSPCVTTSHTDTEDKIEFVNIQAPDRPALCSTFFHLNICPFILSVKLLKGIC